MTTDAAPSSQPTSAQALSDDDAFTTAFSSANTGEHTFVETEAGAQAPERAAQPAEQTSEPAKPESTSDDTAARFARLEAELAQTKQVNGQLHSRLRQVEGRTGQISGDLKVIRTRIEQPAQQPATAQAPASKLEALREEYPAIAEAIEERLPAQPPAEQPAVEEEIDPVTAARYEAVEDVWPGWRDTCKTPQFKAWLKASPLNINLLAESDRPIDAIALFEHFDNFVRSQPSAPAPAAAPAPAPAPAPGSQARPNLRSAVQPGTRASGGQQVLSDADAFAAGFKEVRPG